MRRPTHVITICSCSPNHLSRHGRAQGLDHDRGPTGRAKTPTRLERLPNDLPRLKKWIDRVARDGEVRACYEASGAGYVLHRALQEWGYACEVIAPSLIPKRPGVQRKHDKRDATDLARLYRAGELVVVRIPSERRGFVFRKGTNWSTPHLRWLQHLTPDGSPLAPQDRLVVREYHALLMYKLQRRDELDRQIEADGVVAERHDGTPQGGPLSPLLANVLLDDVDKGLERRGLHFVRYGDDCNVYVQSKRAAERVMEGLVGLYATLELRVNSAKSAVAPVWERSFLGFRFWRAPGKIVKCRVAPKALQAMKERVRAITARTGGRSVTVVATVLRQYLVGWKAYFRLAETPSVFAAVDKWIHRRLRALILRQWKRGRTAYRALRQRGVGGKSVAITARYTRHWWRASRFGAMHLAFPGAYFESLGVPRLGPLTTSTH